MLMLALWLILKNKGGKQHCLPFVGSNLEVEIFQFGQEENLSGNSTERRVYRLVLIIARVFPVPTGRVGIGW